MNGAPRLHEAILAVAPQLVPILRSIALYKFESHVRSATLLGIVGAGGIVQSLLENTCSFQYAETATIIIAVATAMMLGLISTRLRKMLV